MKHLIIFGIVALALTGCASTATVAASTPTPTLKPTATALPPVSLATSCILLYGSHLDGPAPKAADIITRFAAAPNGTTVTAAEIRTVITGLQGADSSASPAIRPYIEAQIIPLKTIETALTGGANTGVELTDFKSSAIELTNQCRAYLVK